MIISLSKKIYGAKAVRKAARAFSEFAKIEIREDGGRMLVTAKGIPSGEEDEFRGEFCNFSLCATRATGGS